MAAKVLRDWSTQLSLEIKPPIDVDSIAENLFNLNLDWDKPIGFPDDALAALEPTTRTVFFNESFKSRFDIKGVYEFTLGHEIGHWVLHTEDDDSQTKLSLNSEKTDTTPAFLCRPGSNVNGHEIDWDEANANRFSSFLLMPEVLIQQEWKKDKDIYHIASLFKVSKQALEITLENYGLIQSKRFTNSDILNLLG